MWSGKISTEPEERRMKQRIVFFEEKADGVVVVCGLDKDEQDLLRDLLGREFGNDLRFIPEQGGAKIWVHEGRSEVLLGALKKALSAMKIYYSRIGRIIT